MRDLGLKDYGAYLDLLRRDPGEAAGLADRMRITVTRFFRERERWDILVDRVLPGLVAALGEGGRLRVWSAGCCGGEEPCTLAMLWLARTSLATGATLQPTASGPPSVPEAR